MSYKDKITNPIFREIVEWIEVLIIAFVIAIFVKTFILETTKVVGDSMQDTLHEDEKIFINRLEYRFADPKRGDIIVFLPEHDNRNYIKRVIGLPGEEVDIKDDGEVYIDGETLNEPYIKDKTYRMDKEFPITVPEGEYFVMGDNRPFSKDSRTMEVGFIPKEKIRGKALLRIWPLDKINLFQKFKYELEG